MACGWNARGNRGIADAIKQGKTGAGGFGAGGKKPRIVGDVVARYAAAVRRSLGAPCLLGACCTLGGSTRLGNGTFSTVPYQSLQP